MNFLMGARTFSTAILAAVGAGAAVVGAGVGFAASRMAEPEEVSKARKQAKENKDDAKDDGDAKAEKKGKKKDDKKD